MPELDFWKRNFSEYDVLPAALKRAGKDEALCITLNRLYYNEQITDEDLAKEIDDPAITPRVVAMRLRPKAQQLIAATRARVKESGNTQSLTPTRRGSQQSDQVIEATITEVGDNATLDEMEAEAVRMVAKANTGIDLHNILNRVVIFLFKTFGPFAVLALTIPESIWVFTHIYSHPDDTLTILTGVFAVLTDFGYLYLTVLLAMNKEAIFKRQRAGIEIEAHEQRAVRLQSILWWLVALMDTLAQVVFLYAATKDSSFFDHRLVMALAAVRIISLFLTMFVVSFAGTELMTRVDKVANEEVERAHATDRIMTALGDARSRRQEARSRLQELLDQQELKRQGDQLIKEIYSDARESIRQRHLNGPDQDLKQLPPAGSNGHNADQKRLH
jgi:hypothetical protein